jgi:hypothetical protein
MLRSAKSLHGYTIEARDGDVGKVSEFLFDDQFWTVRYLVVKTGRWLMERRVLIAPAALGQPSWETQRLPVKLTQEQVEKSPDIDTDQPVSRQQEVALHAHYGWSSYWDMVTPLGSAPISVPQPAMEVGEIVDQGDPHLRSTQAVMGYYIQACDGDIGHVEDFIVDDGAWTIRYMVVDTRNWWPGKKVLVSPWWITEVIWGTMRVRVNMDCETIKNSPPFDPTTGVDRAYEERLHDYYGRPKYWQ